MAIIPAEEKVFMVSNSTNTIYSGSASLKAMQQWYTMQDVIDSVNANGAPTLQQVVAAGNVVLDNTISIYGEGETAISAFSTGLETVTIVNDSSGIGLRVDAQDGQAIVAASNDGYGVRGTSTENVAGYFTSINGIGVYGSAVEGYGVQGNSDESAGGYFTSSNNIGLLGASDYNTGVYGQSVESNGVWGTSEDGYGIYGSSETDYGGYFTSGENYSLVAAQSAAKPGGGSWDAYSDSRVKEDVRPYAKGLTEILLVNPVNYKYNGLASTIKDIEYTGVIAQEIKDIFPETVGIYKAKLNEEDEEKTELYSFNSTALTFALINAVKELNEKIKILEAK